MNALSLGLQPPAAGEVHRLAHVAGKGGVGDRARVPRPGLVGRDGRGEVRAPVGAALVELGQLVGREGAAQATAKLRLDAPDDGLQRRALLRGRDWLRRRCSSLLYRALAFT